jgi:DNA-binding HxlR family transcriptional regulator
MTKSKSYFCPTELTLDVLSRKWKSAIMWILSFGPRRFNELHSLLEGVPKQSLAERLRELEKDGIVSRTQYQSSPIRYSYELTSEGRELWEITRQLCHWGKRRRPGESFPSERCVEQLG